jgi:CHAD domain-containing protein
MAFRFKLGEPLDEGCRRIACEQIDRARAQLGDTADEAVAVHETRKGLKRLRALLRLIRPAMGESTYRYENAQLREIGRSLAGARDRYVMLETVAKLEAASALGRGGLADLLRQSLKTANGSGASVDSGAIRKAQMRLAEVKKRLARLQLTGSGFDIVGPGLERCYRRTRRAFHTAYEELTDEAFHEWRKGTQHHWRQMTLLARAWPEYLGARASEARTLSQLLGDDHDLAILVAFVRAETGGRFKPDKAAAIEKLVRQRQGVLREMARPRGTRLFAEGPKNLCREVADFWHAAVALKELEPDTEEVDAPPARSPRRRRRLASTTAAKRDL